MFYFTTNKPHSFFLFLPNASCIRKSQVISGGGGGGGVPLGHYCYVSFCGTTILHGHPSHTKVLQFAGQSKHLHLAVISRPWVLVPPQESSPWPPALQSSALPTELILPQSIYLHYMGCSYHSWQVNFFNIVKIAKKLEIAKMVKNKAEIKSQRKKTDLIFPAHHVLII